MNILSAIRDQFSPEVVEQIGNAVGESPAATRSALEQSLSALLRSAAARASSPEGATNLFNLVKGSAPQGGWDTPTSNLPANFTAGPASGASSFVNALLGPKASLIRDFIASRSGIRSGSASILLNTAGQLLVGVLGSQVATDSLGASGFGQLLRSQIPHLQGFLSPELAGMLGIGNLLSLPRTPASRPSYTDGAHADDMAGYVPRAGASAASYRTLRWALIPVALLLGAIFLQRHYREADMGGTIDNTSASQGSAISTSPQRPGADLSAFMDRLKTSIASPDGKPVDLQDVSFDSSGNLSPPGRGRIAMMGNLMKDSPEVKTTITVYGATADEAATRGNAIKGALVNMGIADERIALQPEVGEGMPKVSFSK